MEMHGFTYVKRLILKNANYEAFTDFPVYVVVDDSAGYYPTLTALDEIAFYASDNTTELKWGCKEFNDGGISYYKISVPTVAKSNDGFVYMFWGGTTSTEDKAGTCDSATKLETPMVDYGDTSHIEDWKGVSTLTKKGAAEPAMAAGGTLGRYQDFAGDNDYVNCGHDASLNITDTFTIECYIQYNHLDNRVAICKGAASTDGWYVFFDKNHHWTLVNNTAGASQSRILRNRDYFTNTNSYYIAFTLNNSTLAITAVQNSTELTVADIGGAFLGNAARDLYLGSYGGASNYYDGSYGMVRISNTVRSINWLKAQDKILRTQDYITYRGVICTFTLADNQLTTVTGADAGTYPITNNKADIVIGGVTHSIYPFSRDHFTSSLNNLLTIEV